jgi:hypothetical protein
MATLQIFQSTTPALPTFSLIWLIGVDWTGLEKDRTGQERGWVRGGDGSGVGMGTGWGWVWSGGGYGLKVSGEHTRKAGVNAPPASQQHSDTGVGVLSLGAGKPTKAAVR